MRHIDAPALLAYKAGDVISTLVDIPRQIPRGREISSLSIEDLLKQYAHLSSNKSRNRRLMTHKQESDILRNHPG
jgi:hypothetical protein